MNWDSLKTHYGRAGVRVRDWRTRHPRMFGGGAVFLGLLTGIVLILSLVGWRGIIEGMASNQLGHKVTINGDFGVHIGWEPSVFARQVSIANPDWVDAKTSKNLADIGEVTVQVKLWPLLVGHAEVVRLTLDTPVFDLIRRPDGEANWKSGDDTTPTHLPAIRHFAVNDGQLHIDDAQRKIVFQGTLSSRELGSDPFPRFVMEGKGALNRQPFSLQVTGDSLGNVTPRTPYAFEVTMQAGSTHATAHGAIPHPFDFGSFDMVLNFTGDDLADMYFFTGLAFPNTPPYKLAGNLHREGEIYRVQNLTGTVGHSDLAGTFQVDDSTPRSFVTADLKSKRLNFEDLGSLLGGTAKGMAGAVAATPADTLKVTLNSEAAPSDSRLLLPDAPLQVNRVRSMDAKVTYRADTVNSQDLPLSELEFTINLKDGVMRLDPVSFRLRQGRLSGAVRIDASRDNPDVDLDMRLTDAKLEQFFVQKDGAPTPLTGSVLARAKLHGQGLSVHGVASNANGNVTLVVPHGEIRQAFAELLGINVANGLGLLLTGDQSKVDVRCAVANFTAKDGMLRANNIVFDTDVVLASGAGYVNLKRETVDVRLEGHPKQLRLLRVMAPVTIRGNLRHPEVGVELTKAAAQGGIAIALGALLSPLVAVLPFVDPGLANDADCGALLAQAAQKGAKEASPK